MCPRRDASMASLRMRLNFHNYSVYGNDVLFKADGNYFIIAHYHSF
jgi:hypothetical protein